LLKKKLQVGQVRLQRQFPTSFPQTDSQKVGPVKVSLHDCLACSGCITSAETVLLQHQSSEEFVARLSDPRYTVVVSLAPQSVVSLAGAYGLRPADCSARLTGALKAVGVDAVFDISWARDVALIESAQEFLKRISLGDNRSNGGSIAVPMLASACPGWVCYAEKTHGSFILPHISTAKSPQAIMGTVVKRQWGLNRGIDPSKIYHCTVMPCYDKKLEAAREEFCVTTGEIITSILAAKKFVFFFDIMLLFMKSDTCMPLIYYCFREFQENIGD